MNRKKLLLLAAPFVLLGLAFGGAWLYANVVAGDPPRELTLGDSRPTAPAAAGPVRVDGSWTVTSGSEVGYRVDEVLFGQDATAVGRTDQVTGSIVVDGSSVPNAEFTVDMASVRSDRDRRDAQFRTRIMDTATYPTATFRLTQPIELGRVPAEGETLTAQATGELTLRGVTNQVSFEVEARRTGNRLEVAGSILLLFDDWGIPDASFGPAEVGREGALEFLLVLTK